MWISMAVPLYVVIHVTSEQKPAVPCPYFQLFCSEELSPSSCPVRDPGIPSQPHHCKDSLCHTEDTQQGSEAAAGAPTIPMGITASTLP